MGTVDFSLTGTLLAALIIGALQPFFLWPITRVRALSGRNPVQFLWSVVAVVALWLVLILTLSPLKPQGCADVIVGLFALSGAALLYLEIWGLMSRGYTLSILIAMLDAKVPVSPDEIARRYRGGDGLDWIMRHRLGGLEGAGMVERDGDRITLTNPSGLFVARLYALCIAVLGLRKTG
ncbi:MAG: hypothetical protein AAGA88_00360 [Pseudomonadota bacterium]